MKFNSLRPMAALLCLVLAASAAAPASAQAVKKLQTVVIDPGHGGKDPGAVGKSCREKDIVLSVALKLGQLIADSLPEVRTVLTRNTDVFIPLDRRAEIANGCNADLFISIHANWIRNPAIKGAETFVLGLHRSKENLAVAQKENSVIVLEDDYNNKYEGFDPTSPESYIIFELMQNIYLDQSINMASLVQSGLTSGDGRPDRGVKQAGFLVLRKTAMPSILVELGFVSNAAEEAYMKSDEGQNEMAAQLFASFRTYKSQFDARNIISMSAPAAAADTVPAVEEGIRFRIQFASSATPLPDDSEVLARFTDVSCIEEGGRFKYMTGSFDSYDAVAARLKEARKAVSDCFIVAFDNGKKISVREARKKLNN